MTPAANQSPDRTSVSPKADVRATAAASPAAAVATFSDLSDVASSSSESVTAAGASPSPTAAVTSDSVAAHVCRGALAVTGLFMDVPAGKKLALCRVERDDKNQIVLRTMAPISAASKLTSSVEA